MAKSTAHALMIRSRPSDSQTNRSLMPAPGTPRPAAGGYPRPELRSRSRSRDRSETNPDAIRYRTFVYKQVATSTGLVRKCYACGADNSDGSVLVYSTMDIDDAPKWRCSWDDKLDQMKAMTAAMRPTMVGCSRAVVGAGIHHAWSTMMIVNGYRIANRRQALQDGRGNGNMRATADVPPTINVAHGSNRADSSKALGKNGSGSGGSDGGANGNDSDTTTADNVSEESSPSSGSLSPESTALLEACLASEDAN